MTNPPFLSHDMTPHDAAAAMPVGSLSPHPTNTRFQGFTESSMEHNRSLTRGNTDVPRGTYALKGQLEHNDPGHALPGDPSGFYAGMHSSQLSKSFVDPKTRQATMLDNFGGETVRKQQEQKQQRNREIRTHITDYTRDKEERTKVRDAEKRADLEQLKSYDPWGKPGAGAPRQNTTLVSQDKTNAEISRKAPPGYVDQAFGKSGGGAPKRTGSGKVLAHLVGDPETAVHNVYRYNPNLDANPLSKTVIPEYGRALDQQVQAQASMVQDARRRSAEERTKHQQYNPFGRPGAGAPRRADDGTIMAGTVSSFDSRPREDPQRQQYYSKVLAKQVAEREQQENSRSTSRAPDYDPWGKGAGAPQRDDKGRVKPRKNHSVDAGAPTGASLKSEGTSLVEAMGRPGGGAPFARSKTEPAAFSDPFDPFGKPGAGAPIKDATGHSRTKVAGQIETLAGNDRRSPTKAHLRELEREMEEHRTMVEKERTEMRAPRQDDQFFKFGQGAANPRRDPTTGELSPTRRTKSDVIAMTEDRFGRRPEDASARQTLQTELTRIQEERTRTQVEQRQREIDLEKQHLASIGTWQGKGYGSPRRNNAGELDARFGLDQEVHTKEFTNNVKTVSVEQRKQYQTDLDRLAADKAVQRAEARRQSVFEKEHTNVTAGFGKPGHGAPLKNHAGEKETVPSKIRPKGDVEYRFNAVPAHNLA